MTGPRTSYPASSRPRCLAAHRGRVPGHLAVVDCFVEYAGYVDFGGDDLLRGLAWMLDETDDVRLARLAVTAGASAAESPGYPFAPQTAAAAVEILAARPGDLAARTLEQMSRTVVNKALRGRVLKAR